MILDMILETFGNQVGTMPSPAEFFLKLCDIPLYLCHCRFLHSAIDKNYNLGAIIPI